VLGFGDLNGELGHLGLVLIDAHDLGTGQLHFVLLAADGYFVLFDLRGRDVDLGAGARGNVVGDFVVEAADPGVVELGDFEAFEAGLGLLVADELDLVDGLFDALFGPVDGDEVAVDGCVGLGDLDGGAGFFLKFAQDHALSADEELVLLLGHANLLLGFFD